MMKTISEVEISACSSEKSLLDKFFKGGGIRYLRQNNDNGAKLQGENKFVGLPIEHPFVVPYIFSWRHDNSLIQVSPVIARPGVNSGLWLDQTDFRSQRLHEDDIERVDQALQRSLCAGDKFNCHYRLYDSSGKIRWFHDVASVEFDAAGMPVLLKGLMLDITDKKSMESELNELRNYVESKVAQRSEQLLKQIELLESCNESLCRKLELAQYKNNMLCQLTAAGRPVFATKATSPTSSSDGDKMSDGINNWLSNMIGRVAVAGSIA